MISDWFRPKIRHSNPKVRAAAVYVLTDVPDLIAVAKTDADPNVRRVALHRLSAISNIDAPDILQALLHIAKFDTSEVCRSVAMSQLPRSTEVLSQIVSGNGSQNSRLMAV